MFSLICDWINSWVSNDEAGDLRRHRPHYDVIVMIGIEREVPQYVRVHTNRVAYIYMILRPLVKCIAVCGDYKYPMIYTICTP